MTTRVIQYVGEATPGTSVASCTAIWPGTGTPEDQRNIEFANEDVSRYGPSNRPYLTNLQAAWTLDPVPASYNHLPVIFNLGVKSVASGAADGAGTSKIYAFTRPVSAENTIKTATVRGGSTIRPLRSEYTFCTGYKITGKERGPLMMSADLVGRQFTDEAVTGGLTPTKPEVITFQTGKLYIDNVGVAFGNTQVSSVFLGLDLSVKTGWYPYFCGDGNLYFNEPRYSRSEYEAVLKVTFRYHASSVTEETAWQNRTARKIRMKWEGSNVVTPGTTYSKLTYIEDLIGSWSSFEKIGEQNGDDIVTGTFRCAIDDSAATAGGATVVNEQASVL